MPASPPESGPQPRSDVYILLAGSAANVEGVRVGMGFVIGPRHILTCAHVVAASLGDAEAWEDVPDPPPVPVTLAFPFSARHRDPVEAVIEAWWPQSATVANRLVPDDVALLRLPDGFVLPGDVVPAPRAPGRIRAGQPVFVNGVTAEQQNGVSLAGFTRGPVPGNRVSIRSEGGDGNVEQGYSGAAVVTDGGVIGMMAEQQQAQTGLFVPVEFLVTEPRIRTAWPPTSSFVGDAGDEAPLAHGVAEMGRKWLRMSLGSRLRRHLHDCDRVEVCRKIDDAALRSGKARRHPVVVIFGGGDDDLPDMLFDRLQSGFMVEAGHAAVELAYPPRKWQLEKMPWREERGTVAQSLAAMKRRLVIVLGAEGPGPAEIRAALSVGQSQAFYSDLSRRTFDRQDRALMKAWSDYLGNIGQSARGLVHLLRVAPAPGDPAPALPKQAAGLVASGRDGVVIDAGLLPCLDEDDLECWLDSVAVRVSLDWAEIDPLFRRVRRELLAAGPPRLKQLDDWLFDLQGA